MIDNQIRRVIKNNYSTLDVEFDRIVEKSLPGHLKNFVVPNPYEDLLFELVFLEFVT